MISPSFRAQPINGRQLAACCEKSNSGSCRDCTPEFALAPGCSWPARPLQLFPILYRLVGICDAESPQLLQQMRCRCRCSPRSSAGRPSAHGPRASSSPQTSAYAFRFAPAKISRSSIDPLWSLSWRTRYWRLPMCVQPRNGSVWICINFCPSAARWPLCAAGSRVRQIRRIRRRNLFFDLQEQRIAGAVALHIDAIVAQAHRARANNLERHIDGPVEVEQMLPLRLQHFPIRPERSQHCRGARAGDAPQHRLRFLEAAARSGPRRNRRSQLLQRVLRRGALRFAERVVHRLGQVDAVHLEPVHFQLRHSRKRAHLFGVALNACRGGLTRRVRLCVPRRARQAPARPPCASSPTRTAREWSRRSR